MKGDGKGNFSPLSVLQSGIYIPGNGKSLLKLLGPSDQYLVAASQNQDALKLFVLRNPVRTLKILPDDVYAVITFRDKTTAKEEFYYGATFLSQPSRFILVNDKMERVKIINAKGESREVVL